MVNSEKQTTRKRRRRKNSCSLIFVVVSRQTNIYALFETMETLFWLCKFFFPTFVRYSLPSFLLTSFESYLNWSQMTILCGELMNGLKIRFFDQNSIQFRWTDRLAPPGRIEIFFDKILFGRKWQFIDEIQSYLSQIDRLHSKRDNSLQYVLSCRLLQTHCKHNAATYSIPSKIRYGRV